jgi:S-DNA-T family DNA segregation ATPase FtsK/SpoIIIE
VNTNLLAEAAELVVTTQLGSPSMLQRKFAIKFTDALALMDRLTDLGIVGPDNLTRRREVLYPQERYPEAVAVANAADDAAFIARRGGAW